MSNTALANYEQEQALFTELIASDAEPNILLFQGESGSGKSYLIEQTIKNKLDASFVLMTLEGGGDALPLLWTRMGSKLGWEQLPNFTKIVADLLEQSSQATSQMWQVDMLDHLQQVGRIPDLESRLSRYQLLTKAWFADAMKFDRPFLLALDGYEYATTLFDQWFCEQFLQRVAFSPQMRTVVGG